MEEINGLKELVEVVDKELKKHQLEEAAKENVIYWVKLQREADTFIQKVKQGIALTDDESNEFERLVADGLNFNYRQEQGLLASGAIKDSREFGHKCQEYTDLLTKSFGGTE